jgi:STAS domain
VERIVIVCDVSAITEPDDATVDALARLQLEARRLGASIELQHASARLIDLLVLVGLDDVLPLGVAVHGQVEEGEVVGIDEEVHPGDTTL